MLEAEITPEMERVILRELERLGILATCETCGQCEYSVSEAPRCVTTTRGNGICSKSLMRTEAL